jgi:hypothetical protein
MSDIVEDYVTFRRAQESIEQLHLPIPRQVSDEEKITAESFNDSRVGDLNDQELMRFFGLFNGFQAFAEWEVAKADVNNTCASSAHLYDLSGTILTAPDYNSVKEKEAWSRQQSVIIQDELATLRTSSKLTLLKALAKAYEKKAALCSRELSRRMAQAGQNQTTGRFST